MLKKRCFYTSFNKAYAPQALILAESVRRAYGDGVDIVALMVDELTESERPLFAAFDRVVLASELGIPNFKSWIFGLNIVEAATAVKPFALCNLLGQYEHVTYLDPDIVVYSQLEELETSKAKWDIALTPHQTVPQSESWLVEATELESLRFGVYNLGFLSVKATPEGKKAAEWWRARCYDYCVEDVERGLFTDQKLWDGAPALFAGVNIIRHPGYNVATWNLRERTISLQPNSLTSNNSPLRFCHFTKATHIGALAMDRMIHGANDFDQLFYGYLAKMSEKKAQLATMSTKWSFGFYDDGEAIPAEARRQFRGMREKRWALSDPFKR